MQQLVLAEDRVRETIAQQVAALMGATPEDVLAGKAFVEMDSNFDSLALLELQLQLEEAFSFEFDRDMMSAAGKLPRDVGELAQAVLAHHQAFWAKKQAAVPAITPTPSASAQ